MKKCSPAIRVNNLTFNRKYLFYSRLILSNSAADDRFRAFCLIAKKNDRKNYETKVARGNVFGQQSNTFEVLINRHSLTIKAIDKLLMSSTEYTLEYVGMVNESFRITSKRNHLLDSFQIYIASYLATNHTHTFVMRFKWAGPRLIFITMYACVLRSAHWAEIYWGFYSDWLRGPFLTCTDLLLGITYIFCWERARGAFHFLGPFFLWISSQIICSSFVHTYTHQSNVSGFLSAMHLFLMTHFLGLLIQIYLTFNNDNGIIRASFNGANVRRIQSLDFQMSNTFDTIHTFI